jgi:hypothetical protein
MRTGRILYSGVFFSIIPVQLFLCDSPATYYQGLHVGGEFSRQEYGLVKSPTVSPSDAGRNRYYRKRMRKTLRSKRLMVQRSQQEPPETCGEPASTGDLEGLNRAGEIASVLPGSYDAWFLRQGKRTRCLQQSFRAPKTESGRDI